MNDNDKQLDDIVSIVRRAGFSVSSKEEVLRDLDHRLFGDPAKRRNDNWVRRLIRRAERHGRLS